MEARDYQTAEALFTAARSAGWDPAAVEFQIAMAQYRDGHAPQSEKTLLEAIEAIQQQSHPVHEIIVVDDGSTDDTRARLSSLSPQVRGRQEAHDDCPSPGAGSRPSCFGRRGVKPIVCQPVLPSMSA